MFLGGGFSRLGLNADASGDVAAAARYGIAAASMVFIFTSTFGATWLTVPWLYPAEIFPLAVRAKGNAWGVVGWSIGNGWLVSLFFLSSRAPTDKPGTRRLCCFPSASTKLEKKPITSLVSPTRSAFL
jgi:hypothetical protein